MIAALLALALAVAGSGPPVGGDLRERKPSGRPERPLHGRRRRPGFSSRGPWPVPARAPRAPPPSAARTRASRSGSWPRASASGTTASASPVTAARATSSGSTTRPRTASSSSPPTPIRCPPAPGADDNASGVGTLVALAPRLASHPPRLRRLADRHRRRGAARTPGRPTTSARSPPSRASRSGSATSASCSRLDEVGRGTTFHLRSRANRPRVEGRSSRPAAAPSAGSRTRAAATPTTASSRSPACPPPSSASPTSRAATPPATHPTASSPKPSSESARSSSGSYADRMPEGDTIHYAANRIRPILEGHVPDALETCTRASAATAGPSACRASRSAASTPTASTCSSASPTTSPSTRTCA